MATQPFDRTKGPFIVAVIGCGCIGAYVGGKLPNVLQGASPQVYFLINESASGRELQQSIKLHQGFTIQEPGGKVTKVSNGGSGGAMFSTNASEVLRKANLIIVATKRMANDTVLQLIDAHCCADTPAILFQNGLDAPEDFKKNRPSSIRPVYQCIVTINVVSDLKTATFERTSLPNKLTMDSGIDQVAPGTTDMFRLAGFEVAALSSQAFSNAQRGKLLINLWNAPNALSGQPSLHAFLNTGCCLLASTSMQECLDCYHKGNLDYSPKILMFAPRLLRLLGHPFINGLVSLIVVSFGLVFVSLPKCLIGLTNKILRRSPISSQNESKHQTLGVEDGKGGYSIFSPLCYLSEKAHASMWEDLDRKRPTEVDYLNGMVVSLGKKYEVKTATCENVVKTVHYVEKSATMARFNSQQLKSLIR